MNLGPWIKAFRLRTLPLALSSIAMGGFLAYSADVFRWDIFLLCISTTTLLQILSNLANDYGDSIHGADHSERKGPSRAVQSGSITMTQMRSALWVFVVLCLISGLWLLFVSFGLNYEAIVYFFGLGVLCILAAIAYTVGRKPYGYLGLGDISVLIFFGMVGVMGSYYLYAGSLYPTLVLPSFSCGFFSIGVLNVNNIRDIESDRKAGKFSVPVRIGKAKAIVYHWFLLAAGILCAMLYSWIEYQSSWQFIFLLTLPLFLINGRAVQNKPSHELDPYLRQLALSSLVFVLLFGTGLVLSN